MQRNFLTFSDHMNFLHMSRVLFHYFCLFSPFSIISGHTDFPEIPSQNLNSTSTTPPQISPPAECDEYVVSSAEFRQSVSFRDFRLALQTFHTTNSYQKSVPSYLDIIPLYLTRNHAETFSSCPCATLTALLLLTEHSLERLYSDSVTTGSLAALKEAQLHWDTFARLHSRFLQLPTAGRPGEGPYGGWLVVEGERRVRRLFSTIETMARKNVDSPVVHALAVNGSKSVDDEFWERGFNELIDEILEIKFHVNNKIDYFPYGGALIAFLRYGKRTGDLSVGKQDVVEKDIDMFIGVDSAETWSHVVAPALSKALINKRGWEDCFLKSSVPYDTEFTLFARKDLLQCVKLTSEGIPLLADVVSFVKNEHDQSAFFQDITVPASGRRGGAWFLGKMPRLGEAADWSVVYPLKKCKAWNREISCPNDPVKFLEIFNEMHRYCLALPKVFNRDMDDPRNRDLAEKGIDAVDVEIIAKIAEELEKQGYQNLKANLRSCLERDQNTTLVERKSCPGGACGAKLQVFAFDY